MINQQSTVNNHKSRGNHRIIDQDRKKENLKSKIQIPKCGDPKCGDPKSGDPKSKFQNPKSKIQGRL
jgi:uncharacterized low-complexity protein